ncbi:fas apoptotic inhibitory molecule 1 [Phlebotomus papatasi]|uniref:fas apoptotic inhibitory molecule 1 n=1 Tax=Phlebotomus papatasi TaxID=29031 RepID=UPI00248459AE|nr:fas apoptotic inhibitory molecule 1 [Phlebotomus papatasi]
MAESEPPGADPQESEVDKEALERENYARREVAAEWHVPLGGKVFRVEFEHGTASGKRVLWIDGKEILRRDWMFKLVGEDSFHLDGVRCILRVDPAPGFKYTYSLFVGGQAFEQFTERQARALKAWEITVRDKFYRIVLEKDSLNVYLNGKLREEVGEFVDGGADTTFQADGNVFILHSRSSGNKRTGILHSVTVNGAQVPEVDIK